MEAEGSYETLIRFYRTNRFSPHRTEISGNIYISFILHSVFEMRTTSAKPRTNMAFLYPLLAICIRHKSLNTEVVNMDRITPGNNAQPGSLFSRIHVALVTNAFMTESSHLQCNWFAVTSKLVRQTTHRECVYNSRAAVSPRLCWVKYFAYGHVTLHQV